MSSHTETIVLFNELAYEDILALAWHPLTTAPEATQLHHLAERNVRLLQACEALEEHGVSDKKPDDDVPHAAEISRLDHKLNLLLELVGQLVATSHSRPPVLAVRLNVLGASWIAGDTTPAIGTLGMLELHLRSFLVDPLSLFARVESVYENRHVEIRFEAMSKTVADHMERLIFRHHRRRVAGARQPRRV
jgi:hypothetical protein